MTTVTIPASVTKIGSYAFIGSGITTVIFESISNLEQLGFKIINTPQYFYGQMVLISPTKATIQTALTAANEVVREYQNTVTQAEETVTISEIANNQAQRDYEQAQSAYSSAESTLNNTPQYVDFLGAQLPSTAYTLAFNNLIAAKSRLDFALTKSNATQARLDTDKLTLKNAQAQLDSAQARVQTLTEAQSWSVV